MIHGGETELSPHVMSLSSRPQGQRLKSAPLPSGPLALMRRLASKVSASSHVYGIRFCSSKLGYTPHLKARTKDSKRTSINMRPIGEHFRRAENVQPISMDALTLKGQRHVQHLLTSVLLWQPCGSLRVDLLYFQPSLPERDTNCGGFSSYTVLTCYIRTTWLLFNEVSWWFQVEQWMCHGWSRISAKTSFNPIYLEECLREPSLCCVYNSSNVNSVLSGLLSACAHFSLKLITVITIDRIHTVAWFWPYIPPNKVCMWTSKTTTTIFY